MSSFLELHSYAGGDPLLVNVDEIGTVKQDWQWTGGTMSDEKKVEFSVIRLRGPANEGDFRLVHVMETYDVIEGMISCAAQIVATHSSGAAYVKSLP